MPFLFATMPGLLMIGTGAEIALSAGLAAVGIVGLTVAFAGWLGWPIAGWERLALAAASLLILWPTPVAAADAATLAARTAGIVGVALVSLRLVGSRAAPAAPAGNEL